MAWVRFLENFDFKPRASVTIGYRRGMEINVPTRAAAEAVRAGKAVRLKKTHRDRAPVVVDHD